MFEGVFQPMHLLVIFGIALRGGAPAFTQATRATRTPRHRIHAVGEDDSRHGTEPGSAGTETPTPAKPAPTRWRRTADGGGAPGCGTKARTRAKENCGQNQASQAQFCTK